MAKKPDYQKAIAELNRIARAELSGRPERKKRHRHNWQTNQSIKESRREGLPITFTCAECGKTKVV